jgi:hypothetical protein
MATQTSDGSRAHQGASASHRVTLPYWLFVVILALAVGSAGLAIGIFASHRILGEGSSAPSPARATLPLAKRKLAQAAEFRMQMARDPRLGTRVAFPSVRDLDGRDVTLPLPGAITAILYMRQCEQCSFDQDMRLMEAQTAAYPQVRTCMVSSAIVRPEALKQKIRGKGYRSVFLMDRTGGVGEALNAFGTARFYLVSSDAKLLYIENPLDSTEKLIGGVKSAIESATGKAHSLGERG